MKLITLVESIIAEESSKQQIAAMDAAMGAAFSTLGSEFKNNKADIQQDVDKLDPKLNEAVGVLAVIGLILAAPKVVELLAKGIRKIAAVWKRIVKPREAVGQENTFAENIIKFTHKWHNAYITGIRFILKVSGIYKKANIKSEQEQKRVAEVVYYVIIASLAIYSGIQAVGAFKAGLTNISGDVSSFSLASLETALAGIKTSEVVEFIQKVGLKS